MQLLPMASSPDGLISAWYAAITKTLGWEVLTTTSNVNVTQGHGGLACFMADLVSKTAVFELFPGRSPVRQVGASNEGRSSATAIGL